MRVKRWPSTALVARRSSLQYLLDEYGDGPVAASVAPADVARFDEDLRRTVSEQEALPAIEVPLGIPSSHWWWYPPYDPRDRVTAIAVPRRRSERDRVPSRSTATRFRSIPRAR